jgi:single-stranded DNA-binding protein
LSQIAGYVGSAPEVRDGSDGDEFTSFSVGTNRFYDDDHEESTRWYSVAINKPALQDYVLEALKKGTAVVVEGTIRKVEKDGNTYFNMTGYRVGLVDWHVTGGSQKGEDYDPDEDL